MDRTGSNLGELGCLGALVVFFSFFGWRVSKKRLSSGEEREGGGDD